jgi:type IV pilus assembly protein PilW
MTLLELMVAVAVAAILILGLVTIASATSAASLLQRNQAQVQDNVRFAMNLLSRAVRQAGYSPEPWNEDFGREAVTAESADGGPGASDRLAVRGWSDRNCFENLNPDRDADDQPLFYLRESVFDLTASGNLAHRCRYGPSAAELTTQIPRQGVVPGIESFQVLYGEDADGDGDVERWVKAGEWSHPDDTLGVRIGLLAAGDNAVLERSAKDYELLGVTVSRPADGRLRRAFEFATAIRGHTR